MLKRKFSIMLMLVLLLGMISFVSVAEDFSVTIIDDLGNEVTLESEPKRIISLAPSMTEMLFALELEDRIVGVTSFADYPEAALEKEKIGTITEPNIEKIVSLEPDLVFAAGINKIETLNKLEELGIKVAGFSPSSIDETLIAIKKVGKLTNNSEVANAMVAELFINLADIEVLIDRALKGKEKPKVFYEIWNDPLSTAGNGTFIDDIIETAGGINIGEQAKGAWPQFSFEKLLIENPDIYISSPHSASHQVTEETIKKRDNYDQIKAVRNDRIYIIDQNIINRPSPRIIEGLKMIVKSLYPELSDEIDKL
ncbi:MAG: ABC transporter substrate-binding protein [Halanaerobiaceae bacterium]